MRLAAEGAVGGPETGRLEAQYVLRDDVPRLDAEYPAGRQLFAHDGKNATLAQTVEFEGIPDGFEYRCRRQQGFDVIFVQ